MNANKREYRFLLIAFIRVHSRLRRFLHKRTQREAENLMQLT